MAKAPSPPLLLHIVSWALLVGALLYAVSTGAIGSDGTSFWARAEGPVTYLWAFLGWLGVATQLSEKSREAVASALQHPTVGWLAFAITAATAGLFFMLAVQMTSVRFDCGEHIPSSLQADNDALDPPCGASHSIAQDAEIEWISESSVHRSSRLMELAPCADGSRLLCDPSWRFHFRDLVDDQILADNQCPSGFRAAVWRLEIDGPELARDQNATLPELFAEAREGLATKVELSSFQCERSTDKTIPLTAKCAFNLHDRVFKKIALSACIPTTSKVVNATDAINVWIVDKKRFDAACRCKGSS